MGRDYGILHTQFFAHPKINELSLPAQHLMVYLCQGPHSNGIGCYRLPLAYMVSDLRKPIELLRLNFKIKTDHETLVSTWLKELIDAGLVAFCTGTDYIWIRDFLEWNPISNRNVWRGRVLELSKVPRAITLKEEIKQIGKRLHHRAAALNLGEMDREELGRVLARFSNGCETVGEPLRNGIEVPIPIPLPIPIPVPSLVEPPKEVPPKPSGFVVKLTGGTPFSIPAEWLSEFSKAYPDVDQDRELKSLIQWNESNPRKRKTKSGIKRHIDTWLRRRQDEINDRRGHGPTARFHKTIYEDTGDI